MTKGTLTSNGFQKREIGRNWFQEPKRHKNSKRIERLSDWLNITMLLRKNREQTWKKYEK